MFQQIMTNQCKLCGSESVYKEGVSKKNGKAWKGYFCQNKDCKSVDWIRSNEKPRGGASGASGNDLNFQQFVADEFTGLNTRFDKLAEFLKQKFN